MKYFIILLLIPILLSSCFFSRNNAPEGLMDTQIEEGVSMYLPQAWGSVTSSELPEPRMGKIVAAYSSSTQRNAYLNNIVILRSSNTQEESSRELMEKSENFLQQSFSSFELLEEKNFTFTDEDNSRLLIYKGKYNQNTPELIYLQTSKACGEVSYHTTVSLAQELEDYSRYEYLLSSLSCKS